MGRRVPSTVDYSNIMWHDLGYINMESSDNKTAEVESGPMSRLIDDNQDKMVVPVVGEVINGQVIDKSRNALYLDVGLLGVGVIYGRELYDDLDTYKSVKIGDTINATGQVLDNEEGMIELSLREATREQTWQELERKITESKVFQAEILDANKGGLMVRVNGVLGFLPVSQLAPDHYPRVEGGDREQIFERLKSYIGEQFKMKVITAKRDDEKLIVSEKAAIGDELSEVLKKLKEGMTVEGTVSGVADFGAFVKFMQDDSELEGLVHISELAWQRIDNPTDIVAVGDKVEAKVIGVDGLRISLSIKQLREDPWANVSKKYQEGDVVKGEVLKVTPFGGFIKLDNDIHGLVHISEIPESATRDTSDGLEVGSTIDFKIISIDASDHRLGLSIKALTDGGKKKEKKRSKTDKKTTKKMVVKKKVTKKTAAKKKTKEKKEK